MAVWGVRAGRDGENESYAVDNSVVVIGWEDVGDLSEYTGKPRVDCFQLSLDDGEIGVRA
jgi:predicted Mrr-cat superfamily restriction endonuclease